jgi:hypothetical protein
MNKRLHHPWQRAAWQGALVLAGFGALLAGALAQEPAPTGPLCGFTRPGTPNDVATADGLPAGLNDEERLHGLGATVYFLVLEYKGQDKDAWGTGLDGFAKTFQAGLDSAGASSPDLDTGAKYLYLYEVVNDRKTLSPVESTSVQLQVEPREITSWGYFSGVGFATLQPAKDAVKSEIRPVAATSPATPDQKTSLYRDKAPPVLLPQPFRLAYVPTKKGEAPGDAIKLAKGPVQIHWDALDPAVNPSAAILLSKSDFGDGPSFRVNWSKNNLIPAEGRSTVFGFTSNLPPMFTTVRLRGKKVEMQGDKVVPVLMSLEEVEGDSKAVPQADGQVGSPKPEQPKAPGNTPAPAPSASGSGGPGLPPGVPAALGPSGSGASGVGGAPGGTAATGGGGGVAGGSSGQQQQTKQQQQQQQSGQPVQITINNQNQQQQQQRQQQQQKQKQHQNQNQDPHGHEVVPGPATLVLAALGLPALFLFRRRRVTPCPE